MSEPITIVVTDPEELVVISAINPPPIFVTFSDVAVADPKVDQARDEAVAAAQVATDKAQEAVDAVAGLDTIIDETVDAAIEAERPNSIINALIFG